MTCHEFETQLDAYAHGTIDEEAAAALELHASECHACETRIDGLPRVSPVAFSPALPPGLRAVTLAAVEQTRVQRTRRRWVVGAALAAAALITIVALPRLARVAAPGTVASAPHVAPRDQSLAGVLATERAVTEFNAIDAAARELRAALDAAPGDAQLRAFLASVTSQREQLRRRVEDART